MKVPKEMLKLAEHILDTKKATSIRRPSSTTTRRRWSRCCKHKQAGTPVPTEKAADAPRNVINLMDALRKSVAAEKGSAKAAHPRKKARRQARGAAPHSPQFKFPIEGGKAEAAERGRGAQAGRRAGFEGQEAEVGLVRIARPSFETHRFAMLLG